MKGLLLVLGLAVTYASAHTAGLRVKFDIGLSIGSSFFYDMPRNKSAAVLAGFTPTQRPAGPLSSLLLYCMEDRIVCVFFDDNGFVAGLQVALPQDQFTGYVLDFETQGYTEWVPPTSNGTIKKYWTKQQYFVDEDYLALSAADRLASYNSSKTLQLDAVWLSGFNTDLDKVGTSASYIKSSAYTEQNCVPWMGRHYFHKMTSETLCESDTMYPWFLTMHNGYCVATGLLAYGKMSTLYGQRNWFENPNRLAVQVICPGAPKCLLDMVDDYGLVSMHVYYIEQPWSLGCLEN